MLKEMFDLLMDMATLCQNNVPNEGIMETVTALGTKVVESDLVGRMKPALTTLQNHPEYNEIF
jgi:hypothetical protein